MVGPLLGGIAFEWLGMKGAYTITALVQFAGAFALAGLVHPQLTRRLDLARIPAEIAEGLAFAWTKPTILLVWGITVVTNAFAFAYSGLVAPLGIGAFHVSPALVGLLAAAEPIGALAGGALIAAGVVRMDRRLTFAGGAALFMVALIVMALSPSYWLAFAVLVLGGFGTAGFGNMQTTLMLTEAPADMRSRLMGIVTVGIGTGPLGVVAAGAIATEFGPRTAVLVMASAGTVLHRGAGDMAEAPQPLVLIVAIANRLHEAQDHRVAFELGREDGDHPIGPPADDVGAHLHHALARPTLG